MRIIHLTPGTGNFHCGSCLRDHALIRAMRAQGHDVVMVPLYLPFVLEESESEKEGTPATEPVKAPLFLGGINMYLQERYALFRWTPRWIDKFLNREKFLLNLVERSDMTSPADLGALTLASFQGLHGKQRKEVAKLIDWLKNQAPADVISFSNGLLTGVARSVHEALRVPVVCSLQGEDSFLDTLPEPYREQCWEMFRENAKYVARFLAVSEYYAEEMKRRLRLEGDQIVAVHNGIDYTPFRADPSKRKQPPVIGYLARMCHGKGMHLLVDAFIDLRQRETVHARLHLAGAKTSVDDAYIDAQKRKLQEAGLLGDVTFSPNISREEKVAFLQSLSVFSVPALYGESFGLYVLEALGCEVPVVQPNHAAFPEILERTGGGLLFDPEDPITLADSLEVMLTLEERRRKLGHEGGQKARRYFNADRMAADAIAVYQSVLKT